jgi:hypothetical protein
LLDPSSLNFIIVQPLRGVLTVDVEMMSSDMNVGTIAMNTDFDPMNAGSTMLDIATPGEFDTPSNLHTITATVAP